MEGFPLGNPFTRGFISAVPQNLASLLYSNVDVWESSSCFLAELLWGRFGWWSLSLFHMNGLVPPPLLAVLAVVFGLQSDTALMSAFLCWKDPL